MPSEMTFLAQPTHVERFAVIVVVSFNGIGRPASLAIAPYEDALLDGFLNHIASTDVFPVTSAMKVVLLTFAPLRP